MTPAILAEIEKIKADPCQCADYCGCCYDTDKVEAHGMKVAKAMLALLCKLESNAIYYLTFAGNKYHASASYSALREKFPEEYPIIELCPLEALASANAKLAERDAKIQELEQENTEYLSANIELKGKIDTLKHGIEYTERENSTLRAENEALEKDFRDLKQVFDDASKRHAEGKPWKGGIIACLDIIEDRLERSVLRPLKAGDKHICQVTMPEPCDCAEKAGAKYPKGGWD